LSRRRARVNIPGAGTYTHMGISIRDYKSPEEALKALEKRRAEIEKEMELLVSKRDSGEISEDEFLERKAGLEREFIEVMDRLTQLRFILGR